MILILPNLLDHFLTTSYLSHFYQLFHYYHNTTTKKITIAINTVSNTITMTPNPATPRNTGEAGTQNGIAKGPIVLTIN